MSTHLIRGVAVAAAVFASASVAGAELPTQKMLPISLAIAIAQTAYNKCLAEGYRTSVHVLDRTGQTIVALRGDGANPHTFENSRRKAYTALTFRAPSATMAKNLADPATAAVARAAATLPGVIALGGGLPILAGNEILGGVGVSGAPKPELDEACSKAGIDKVLDQLK
jgi:uncharacterized protein GlcG (DUF336 family)